MTIDDRQVLRIREGVTYYTQQLLDSAKKRAVLQHVHPIMRAMAWRRHLADCIREYYNSIRDL